MDMVAQYLDNISHILLVGLFAQCIIYQCLFLIITTGHFMPYMRLNAGPMLAYCRPNGV